MKAKQVLYLGLILPVLFLPACSSTPSKSEARKALVSKLNEQEKRNGGKESINLVSFEKIDELSGERSGIKFYNVKFEAKLAFPEGRNTQCINAEGMDSASCSTKTVIEPGGQKTIKGELHSKKTSEGWKKWEVINSNSFSHSTSKSNNSDQSQVDKWENAALVQSFNSGDDISSISFGSSNQTLVTKGHINENFIKIWDTANSDLKQQFPLYPQDPTTALVIQHDNEIFFSSKGNLLGVTTGGAINDSNIRIGGPVEVWNLETGSLERSFAGNNESILTADLNNSGTLLATGNENAKIKLWNFSSQKLVHTYIFTQSENISDRDIWQVEFGPDGETLVSTNGSEVKLWNTEAGSLKSNLDLDGNYIRAVKFKPNNAFFKNKKKILAVGQRNTVEFCHIGMSSTICNDFTETEHIINSLAFSPNGKFLVTASGVPTNDTREGNVKVWNVDTGELITTLSRMETTPIIDIGPNGEKIAVAGKWGRVRIWEISD
jgi:WD40 repeat protein